MVKVQKKQQTLSSHSSEKSPHINPVVIHMVVYYKPEQSTMKERKEMWPEEIIEKTKILEGRVSVIYGGKKMCTVI